MKVVDDLLKALRILPRSTANHHGEELRRTDVREEERLRKAADRVKEVGDGSLSEEEFWALLEPPGDGSDDLDA